MTKRILYLLSVLVAGAAAFYSFENSKKLQNEIDVFTDTRTTKRNVEDTISDTEKVLADTEGQLETAKSLNADLINEMENMKSREAAYNRTKEEEQVKIDEANDRLEQLAEIKAKIDKALEGVDIPWPQIPSEIKRLQELRKKKGDDLDLLNEHIAKLTKDVADKRASNARESDRLSKIRTKIARNAKVGAITSVNSTWGFVIVNLGTNNSNVTDQSKLLVTRNGRLLGRLTPHSVEASQTVCDLNARDINPGVRIQPGDQVVGLEDAPGFVGQARVEVHRHRGEVVVGGSVRSPAGDARPDEQRARPAQVVLAFLGVEQRGAAHLREHHHRDLLGQRAARGIHRALEGDLVVLEGVGVALEAELGQPVADGGAHAGLVGGFEKD